MFDLFKKENKPLNMAVYDDTIHSDENKDHKALLTPFAVDDAILNAINQGKFDAPLAIHFWPTAPTVILGGMDTRLADFKSAVTWLHQEQGIFPVVRPAGGLAVVSDPEVLNVTLLLDTAQHKLSIDQAYEFIVTLLQKMMDEYDVELEVGEIETSYCPGKFDVSINGKKIAGIAQRRIGHAVGIYIYISIAGDQAKRGQLIQDMYRVGKADLDEKDRYPQVDPNIMQNLIDVSPINTVEDFMKQILAVITAEGVQLEKKDQRTLDVDMYVERMEKRNQEIYDILLNQ